MLWKDRQTDRLTDGQTDGWMKCIPIIPSTLHDGELIIIIIIHVMIIIIIKI